MSGSKDNKSLTFDFDIYNFEIDNVEINKMYLNKEDINEEEINEEEIDGEEANDIKVFKIINYKECPECNIQCQIEENSIVCPSCGLIREWSETGEGFSNSRNDYNLASNSYIDFSFVGGKEAHRFNKNNLSIFSNYEIYRSVSNRKELLNIVFQHSGNRPPNNVINEASELFDKIAKSGHVYRKNGKRGVMAACLYYSCIANNLARTPKDISAIMNIEEKYLSHGDRILQDLNEQKIITIPTNYDPLDDYIKQYFPLLGIPDKYSGFVKDIIKRAEYKNIHVMNECRTTTKCIGAIYILTKRVRELNSISKDIIAKECNGISKTTFIKYANLLMDNHRLIKKSFKRNGIKMPKEWRRK